MENVARSLWLLLVFALSAGQGVVITKNLWRERQRIEARLTVKRLCETTLRFFQGKRPPEGPEFWRTIGRDAVKDPWGEPYTIVVSRRDYFEWRSAGPDRVRGNNDDIFLELPYGEDFFRQLTQPDTNEHGLRSRDAK